MRCRLILVSRVFFFIFVINVQAGTTTQSQGNQNSDSAIRRIDFLNFTYHPNLCNQEYGKEGIGRAVKVHNGKFEKNEVYYGVVDNRVIYGDLTGNNSDVAVVHNGCGQNTANFGLSEIFVFTVKDGKAVLLATLNDKDMERAYLRYNPNGTLWKITDSGVKIVGGNLIIERFADGPHASPKYVVTLQYSWNGKQLVLNTQLQKRAVK